MDGRSRTTRQASSTGKTGKAVLDASALLAYLFDEPGAETVAEALASGVAMSAVNLSEVLAKLEDHGVGVDRAIRDLTAYGILDAIEIMDFTLAQAQEAARLRTSTTIMGLSLADRACLALAKTLGLPALTADSTWTAVPGVSVRLIP
ncbi:MAG: type II toxin-antitoxin system VapC family toxin [Limnochordales bacterium]|nr:type II toxin-antitoxin system VapC family toxin [Limnochordales bacterium]